MHVPRIPPLRCTVDGHGTVFYLGYLSQSLHRLIADVYFAGRLTEKQIRQLKKHGGLGLNLPELLRELEKSQEHELAEAVRNMDSDGDGLITLPEVLQAARTKASDGICPHDTRRVSKYD